MRVSGRLLKIPAPAALLSAALFSGLLFPVPQAIADELSDAERSASHDHANQENSGTDAGGPETAQDAVPVDSAPTSSRRFPPAGTRGRIVIEDADGRRQEYALPLAPFTSDAEDLTEASDQPRCMIGVICRQPEAALRQHLKLGQRGLLVTAVSAGLPADAAGIQEGDLLLRAGEKDLSSVQDLVDAVAAAGEKPLKILRLHQGEPVEAEVIPCKATDQDAFATLPADDQAERMAEFLKQLPITDAERKALQIRPRGQIPMLQRVFGPALEIRDTDVLDRNMAGLMRDAESSRGGKAQAPEPQTAQPAKSDQQEIAELRQLIRELSLRVEKLEAKR